MNDSPNSNRVGGLVLSSAIFINNPLIRIVLGDYSVIIVQSAKGESVELELLDYTSNPTELIALSAGTCYGKNDGGNQVRIARCYHRGHMSVFEHAKATFKVYGISRACANQLVRHRMASYAQESQRYVKLEASDDSWYVIPPKIKHSAALENYVVAMRNALKSYDELIEMGIPAEDARYVLPNAAKTNLVVTMNCRELYHFFDLRLDKSAQWEIRELAMIMKQKLASQDAGWSYLMGLHTYQESAIM